MPIRNRPGQPGVQPTRTNRAENQPIAVQSPAKVTDVERDEAAEQAAKKLLDTVTTHKDLDGDKALAGWGQGDARVTSRRSALQTLIAEKSGIVDEADLAKISAEIKKDISFIKSTDMREYTANGTHQFDWFAPFANHTVDVAKINREFTGRVGKQAAQAKAVDAGSQPYFNVATMSVIGLGMVKDGSKRSSSMMDALLQFRGRTDSANQSEDARTTRIDRFGTALLAEQRALLGSLALGQGDLQSNRDYALIREVISSHPISSTNQIYEARNAVSAILTDQGTHRNRMSSENSKTAWVWKQVPPGATASPYSSIHHNFSRDTPKNIRLAVEEWMMPVGPRAARAPLFMALVGTMHKLQKGKAGPRDVARLTAAAKASGVQLPAIDLADAPAAQKAILALLTSSSIKDLGNNPAKNLEMMARTYKAVCTEGPSVDTLQNELFRAGDAWPEVADVIVKVGKGDAVGALHELGEARLAMRKAIVGSKSGYERHERIKFDSKLAHMTNEYLGACVERVGDMKLPAEQSEALVGIQAALRSAVASGLGDIVSDNDQASTLGSLEKVLADVDAVMNKGSFTETKFRHLMADVHQALSVTTQNFRAFADERTAHVAQGGVTLDPMFKDQFVKQTPLHYATALTQKGMMVGLNESITARKVSNVDGMRVLNGIGPVVFREVVFAENSKQLAELGTTKDQLAILYKLEEKKMVAVGGLTVDVENAPGGNSHLNMYAMNNGIPVLALPELRTKYQEFFLTAKKEGGIYMDDSDGFTMMTVKKAQEDGLIGTSDVDLDRLRPGVNRKIKFLRPTSDGMGFEVAGKHDAIINDQRITHDVEIYLPQDTVRGIGKGVPSWDKLATLGVHARHLAGEKGTVLSLLAQNPKLAKYCKPGSTVTPFDVDELLAGATFAGKNVGALWDAVWEKDPAVGVVDDHNFHQSALYTDAGYRKQTREMLQTATREGLESSLLDMSKTPPTLTDAGVRLYRNILGNDKLKNPHNGSLIFRSSFTAEDRPGKSGAGQYESYVDRSVANKMVGKDAVNLSFANYEKARDKAAANPQSSSAQAEFLAAQKSHNALLGPARVWGAIGVIESAWMPEPVENNVAEEFFLKHVGCTIAVQATVKPDISGVIISRDLDSGARGSISFQLVKGFGGGVEGGKTTEGVVSASGTEVHVVDGKAKSGTDVDVFDIKVSKEDMTELRDLVLETERFFHETIEPGKGHAVDMEVARQDGQWYIVQARVIQMDK